MRIAQLVLSRGLGILLILPTGVAFAQSAAPPSQAAQAQGSESQAQSSSALASAAKRVRDDKKDQAQPARVWDNDNIPKAGHEISIIGQKDDAANDGAATAPPANSNSAVAPAANGGPEGAAKNGGNVQSQIDSAKQKLASMKIDLDLMQRTLVLDSEMYYAKPDYSTDTDGAKKIQDEQTQIAEKQAAVEEAEKQIAELENQLRDSPQSDNPQVNRN
jgi:hypothetical protein